MNTREQFLNIYDKIDFNNIRDHPNILIAANFWEEDRFCAARICYKFMRAVDDMIDDHKAKYKTIATGEKRHFSANVEEWLKMIINSKDCNPLQTQLIETLIEFRIPVWPMEAFAKSMIWDINNDGFPTINSFLDYSQGASVAPASVFVHLNGITKKNGKYTAPSFSVKDAATPCALFSYLVHIIRDFRKDQLNNLNYFADDLIKENGLTSTDLLEFAHGRPVNCNFRNLIRNYYMLADEYRLKTLKVLKDIRPLHQPRYRLSLDIIFDLYVMVFERIDLKKGLFTTEELNPTPEEIKERVYKNILKFKS